MLNWLHVGLYISDFECSLDRDMFWGQKLHRHMDLLVAEAKRWTDVPALTTLTIFRHRAESKKDALWMRSKTLLHSWVSVVGWHDPPRCIHGMDPLALLKMLEKYSYTPTLSTQMQSAQYDADV